MNRADQKAPHRRFAVIGALVTFALLLGVFLNQKKADDIIIPTQSIPETEESNAVPVAEKAVVAEIINEEESPHVFSDTDEAIFESVDLSMVDDSALQQRLEGAPINRYRVVKVNTDRLWSHIRNTQPNDEVFLHLFEDVVVRAIASDTEEYDSGERQGLGAWRGSVNGDLKSIVTFSIAPNGMVSITVSGEIGSFKVTHLSQQPYHIIMDYIFSTSH